MESALLLCVPEAEPLVARWRTAGDPSAARGVPAHVTLLYPFLDAARVDAGVLGELEWFFRGVDAFRVRFTSVQRFEDEGVVYLAPEDPRLLVDLTSALVRRWPECPPYGGRYESVVPHLTVVHSPDRALRQSAGNAVSEGLPLTATLASASLWTCDDAGAWSERATFPLAAPE